VEETVLVVAAVAAAEQDQLVAIVPRVVVEDASEAEAIVALEAEVIVVGPEVAAVADATEVNHAVVAVLIHENDRILGLSHAHVHPPERDFENVHPPLVLLLKTAL